MRNAFQQKSVHVKRHYLHEFETIARLPQNSMRSFVNRYRRVEVLRKAIGVDVALSYGSKSRGSRLLGRAKLSLDQQQMVPVGTGQQLHYEAVRSALTLQFPEHKPSPPVFGRENLTQNNPKGQSRGKPWTPRTPTAPGGKNNGFRKGNGKGDGSYSRQVLAVSAEDEEQKQPQDDEVEDAVDGLETTFEDANEGNTVYDGGQEVQEEYGEDDDQ